MRVALVAVLMLVVMEGGFGEMPSPETPEFYFTRLIYRPNPRTARSRNAWATDAPEADYKFMWGIQRMTNARVYPDIHAVEALDLQLFNFPYLYAVEVGQMDLNQNEAAAIREYLLRGGFLHCDDFWGLEQLANFQLQMTKVFPDRKLERIPLSHEIFRTFFEVDQVVQVPNINNGISWKLSGGRTPTWQQPSDTQPGVLGISDDDGRLMVVATYNSDLGDAWEWMDHPDYPAEFTGWSYRMGMNFIIYAMTH
jgi:hypothetical protein